jgi:periplasmic copper chaperone A
VRQTLSFALALAVAACGSSGTEVSEARLAQPTGPNAALYLVVSTGADDALVAAATPVAARVELHETTMDEAGTMTMHPADSFPVAAGEPLTLEPGGRHLMLVDVDRLEVGDSVEVTLTFAEAGDVTLTVPVVAPGDVMAGHG